MLTKRRVEIFKAIVSEFIQTAEPVGSKYLIEKYKWNYSSATVRNEMSVLEELGLLEKTHTSSGRIPSTKGYQFYTQHLMEKSSNDKMEMVLQEVFKTRSDKVEDALQQSVDILSQMTNLTSAVLGPEGKKQRLQDIRIVEIDEKQALVIFETDHDHRESKVFNLKPPVTMNDLVKYVGILNDRLIGTNINEIVVKMESLRPILQVSVLQYEQLFEAFASCFVKFASDRMYFSGKDNLLDQPEFSDINKVRQLMIMLEDSALWRDLINDKNVIAIQTGTHTQTQWIDDVAVVTAKIHLSEDQDSHQLMVVGPSRMEYSKVVSLVEYITQMIEEVYGNK